MSHAQQPHAVIPMKTIGILGGMSSQATAEYYRLINAGINQVRGGWNAAELLICSVNFANIEAFVRREQWDDAANYLVDKALKLEQAGADFIVMATNTLHRVAPQIEAAIEIPLIHIVDVTAAEIRQQGITKVGILGTKPVMQADFYRDRFKLHGIELIAPSDRQCQIIDTIIFDELVHRSIQDESRQIYIEIMQDLGDRGAQVMVLGCTEISLLVEPEDFPDLPLFDTTALHCQKAVNLALEIEFLPVKTMKYSNPR
ncbi:aspartate/glutamate racemase family protein [Chroococcidiopsis thermalis]|uniref:Aspartate racemase n=1 Tax=Chroococcidiopsis thermalis (strain PCC 7203) TaxID=251229 RepID=K9TUT8_CHRTP|nr:aspartate/glutamate racemase family protein [Chroococcidiopsis thermalis]AFY85941.1 aspartate racemase [Chroococcidiopsis thermalis PCC 7203]